MVSWLDLRDKPWETDSSGVPPASRLMGLKKNPSLSWVGLLVSTTSFRNRSSGVSASQELINDQGRSLSEEMSP